MGLKSPVHPGSSAAQRKRRSKCLQGRKHAHTRAWVEKSRLERRLGAARLDPLPTLSGTRWRRWPARFSRLNLALPGQEDSGGGGGTRGGRRARAARQEALSRRLVTARLGAHGCAREPGEQASAPLRRAPGNWKPRRGCPRPHPRARSARLDGLSGTRTAEIHLSVQGQDRNSASGV